MHSLETIRQNCHLSYSSSLFNFESNCPFKLVDAGISFRQTLQTNKHKQTKLARNTEFNQVEVGVRTNSTIKSQN